MRSLLKGTTDYSAYFYIVGDSGHANPGEPVTGLLFSDIETGGSASYMRSGAARVDLTLITQTVAGAHSDGGFIEVDATNMPGVYRCDYPDAAFATGVDEVILQFAVASAKNAIAAPIKIQLTGVDLQDAVGLGLSRLDAAVSSRLAPTVAARTLDVAAGGEAGLDMANVTGVLGQANVGWVDANSRVDVGAVLGTAQTAGDIMGALTAARMQVLDDWINAGRLDAILDLIAADVVNLDGAAMRGTDSALTDKDGFTLSTAGVLAVWHQALSAVVTAGSVGKLLKDEITSARMAALTDWIDGGRLDLLLDAIPTTAMRGTDSALTDKDGFTLSTAGILAVWHQALTAIVTAGSVGKLVKDEVTAARMAILTDWINGGRLDLLIDDIITKLPAATVDGLTPTQLWATVLASCAGRIVDKTVSPMVIQNPDGTQTRVSVTTDRGAVTLSFTGV